MTCRAVRRRRRTPWRSARCGRGEISAITEHLISIHGRRGHRRLPTNTAILVRIQPEDGFERTIEIGRQPPRELDGRDIATDLKRQNRVAGDSQGPREVSPRATMLP